MRWTLQDLGNARDSDECRSSQVERVSYRPTRHVYSLEVRSLLESLYSQTVAHLSVSQGGAGGRSGSVPEHVTVYVYKRLTRGLACVGARGGSRGGIAIGPALPLLYL